MLLSVTQTKSVPEPSTLDQVAEQMLRQFGKVDPTVASLKLKLRRDRKLRQTVISEAVYEAVNNALTKLVAEDKGGEQ
jgi:hypothetical protein